MASKDDLIRRYKEYKDKYQAIPKFLDFCKFAGIYSNQLIDLFGRNAYAKFQEECGDEANKLNLERTPTETILKRLLRTSGRGRQTDEEIAKESIRLS